MSSSTSDTRSLTMEESISEPDYKLRSSGLIQGHGVVIIADEGGVIRMVSENTHLISFPPASELIGQYLREYIALRYTEDKKEYALEAVESSTSPKRLLWCKRREYRKAWQMIELYQRGQSDLHTVGLVSIPDLSAYPFLSIVDQPGLLNVACKWLLHASGIDAVLAYIFDVNYNGEVVEEITAPGIEQRFIGLHFPKSDLPTQARQLYLQNTLRHIADTSAAPFKLLNPGEHPVDLTHSILRAVHPCHLKYMANMGVKSSFSLAMIVNKKLYGMFLGHSYRKPCPISPQKLESFKSFGDIVSLKMESIMHSRLVSTKSDIENLLYFPSDTQIIDMFKTVAEPLLQIFKSDTCLLIQRYPKSYSFENPAEQFQEQIPDIHVFGRNLHIPDCESIFRRLKILQNSSSPVQLGQYDERDSNVPPTGFTTSSPKPKAVNLGRENGMNGDIFYTDSISRVSFVPKHTENSVYSPAGFLYISCFLYDIVFLRAEQIETVHWAGKVQAQQYIDRETERNPRDSFEKYVESIEGKSMSWTRSDIELAIHLRSKLLININNEIVSFQRDVAMLAAKQKSVFLSHMSHELRTPFNGVVGLLGMLRESALSKEQLTLIDSAFECAEHMVHLLDDILLLSKMNAKKLELEHTNYDLIQLLESVRVLFLPKAMETKNVLQGDFSNFRVSLFHGDSGRLRQVVMNLVANALKFTYASRVVITGSSFASFGDLCSFVRSKYADYKSCNVSREHFDFILKTAFAEKQDARVSWVTISVLDEGEGVSPQVISRLFGEFEQVSEDSTASFKGTGLGLFISKSLIELMGGYILCFSTKGHGSEFIFFFPAVPSRPDVCPNCDEDILHPRVKRLKSDPDFAQRPQSPSTMRSRSLESQQTRTLLVADDNAVNRNVLMFAGRKCGFRTTGVQNGQELVHEFTTDPDAFTCILCDMNMPIVSGKEAVDRIRSFEMQKNRSYIPIIAHTASSLDKKEKKEVITNYGVDGVLCKPISYDDLHSELLRIGVLLENPD